MKFLKTLSKNIFDFIIVPILLMLSILLLFAVGVVIVYLPGIIFQILDIETSFWVGVIHFEWLTLIFSLMCSLMYPSTFSLKGVLLLTLLIFTILSLISGYIALCIHFHLLLWITLSLIVIGVLTVIVIKSYKETKM